MSFPEIGQKAEHTRDKVIGVVAGIDGETVTLRFSRRWFAATFKDYPLSELTHVCQATTSSHDSYGYRECGRPVKEGNLCGIHNGARKRRENQKAKWRAEEEAARVRRDQAAATRARMEQEIKSKGLTEVIEKIDPVQKTVTLSLSRLLDLLRNA